MNNKLFTPLSQTEASTQVKAIAIYYPTVVRLFIPTKPILKLKGGMELAKRHTKIERPKTNTEDDADRALRKTKRTITDYVLCNKFSMFVTFTFSTERHDSHKSKAKMNNWLKHQRKRMKKFKYLIVPEEHKDGALHFHGLLMNYEGNVERATNPHTGRPLSDKKGRAIYQLPGYRSGFTTVKLIEDKPEAFAATARYLKKYIIKDMPLVSGKNRYWVSKGLNKPFVVDNPLEVFDKANALFEHQSDYGRTLIYPYKDGVNHYDILSVFLKNTDELLV